MADVCVDHPITSLNCEELCDYLQNKGLDGEDLQKIRDGGYNGKTVFLLALNNKERLYRLKLSDSSTTLLEMIFDTCHSRSHLQRTSKQRTKKPSSGSHSHPKSSIEATNEDQVYTSFGLGYGIDASDPSALRSRHGKVRIVLPNLSNVEESLGNRRDTYKQEISSLVSHKESVNLSVSDLVGKVLTLSAEAEYAREKSREMIAKGERVITRCVSFKPFCSAEYNKDGEPPEDSNLEQELCKWIVKQIPDIQAMPGATLPEKVQLHLTEFPEDFDDIVAAAYLFVKTEKVTHYIQAVDLGAAKYSISTISKSRSSITAGVEAGVDYIAGLGAKAKRSIRRSNKTSKHQLIGNIDQVSRGHGEDVVGFRIMPAFMLVEKGAVKRVLQKAMLLYLDRASGPFIISCGRHNDTYLRVVEQSQKRVVLGDKNRGNASIFYIEKSVCPNEFNMAYYGTKEDALRTEPALYLTTNTKFSRYDDGVLEVGGARASNFTLRHPSKKKEDLFIEFWETDSCYIKVAPRRLQKMTLVGLNESTLKTVCVHSFKEEEKRDMWLRFQLHRTRNEISDRVTIYRARATESEAVDGDGDDGCVDDMDDISESSEEAADMAGIKYRNDADYFEDFEFEFEPALSDEEDSVDS